jgi:phosphatidylserine/phosphatidylglycerophosphate/cardiolipin synthase-like enzyme
VSLPENTRWRIERANRAAVIVDADDYFRLARAAMMKAEKQILLVGWDFDARIRLAWKDEPPGIPTEVGEFINWLVKRRPDLNVHILRWDKGAFKTLFRGKTLLTLTKWRFLRKRIHLLLDGYHPIGASQHQKIVVIDDCLAFCGGIDMTDERWDTRQHRDDDPHRVSPHGWPNKPWHDATTALEGPVAAALGDLCRTLAPRGRCSDRPTSGPVRLLADGPEAGLLRCGCCDFALPTRIWRAGIGSRNREPLRVADRPREAAHLCRKPVFRLPAGR